VKWSFRNVLCRHIPHAILQPSTSVLLRSLCSFPRSFRGSRNEQDFSDQRNVALRVLGQRKCLVGSYWDVCVWHEFQDDSLMRHNNNIRSFLLFWITSTLQLLRGIPKKFQDPSSSRSDSLTRGLPITFLLEPLRRQTFDLRTLQVELQDLIRCYRDVR
jgi:hypothetical protein